MAGGRAATLTIKVLTDAASGIRGLQDTAGSVGGLEGTMRGLAAPAAATLGIIAGFGVVAATSASDAEQSMGALESVFKDQADAAKAFADAAAENAGLSAASYAQMAAVIGAQLKRTGTPMNELAGSTDELIQLGADLAAQFGGSSADAVAAIGSLMRGERDPIERYAVGIKQADVNARLAAEGLDGLTGEAKTQAEAQATLALLMEQTADAQGAFARESDTMAGSMATAEANMADASAQLGQVLLPIVAEAAGRFADLAKWVEENATLVQIIVGVIAVLAGTILAVNVAMSAYAAIGAIVKGATVAWTAVQWLLNAALTANPIGLVVAAIVALVAIFVVAYNKSKTFRDIVDGVFKAVVGFVKSAVSTIESVFKGLLDILVWPFKQAQKIIDGIMDGIGGFLEILPGGKAAPAPTAGLLAAGRGLAATTAGSVPGRDTLKLGGSVTVTHRIEDPHGALANLPGGAAEVARRLNQGTEALGLYRNLQHAAGIR